MTDMPVAISRWMSSSKARGMFITNEDGVPSLFLSDAAGKMRGVFSTTEDGGSSLAVYDAQGKATWSAP